ncbi:MULTISPECIES: nucleotide exchange factor GrpE [Marinobacter]|jgi:molecular chaperone GrpE|uniref:nucleotide exchange factor GrpE n=1 Tax=Marinobacter TaxID=2742 RepID=UPI00027773ED|nr:MULTISPECIES: nucleotide exchange factor GrpE [Marinobacter]AFP32289.1 Protein grpE [Marinobacter sp. BSs20148]MBQ0762526.1 nucleotide exchange factor GrpE [Marinobacter psychrophilus]MBQ0846250.1 nucleotide exchange factor GrpE [Marinobacter psychrophilus]
MSTDEERNEQFADELQQAVDKAAEENVEAAEGEPESSPSADLEALQAQVQEFQEQVLRSHAEMQNVRRRAENDVEKAHKFAVEKFVKELLPVVDSLEKAVESTEGHESSGDLVASIRQGVELTLDMFLSGLKKFNVERLNPVGEPFDPQYHEAMSMVPAPNAEPNSVVAVMQKGYLLNGRVVRPAMVMVAKPQDAPKIDEQA